MSTARDRENLARFGITAPKAFGVSMANVQVLAKRLGRNHELAAALWDTGWYEARMLASFVDEPARVTPAQMDRWCRDFDNWAICDTVCFHLFDRTPHAWAKVAKWHDQREEFVQARGLRAAREPRAARQGHRRPAVCRQLGAHRARGDRRAELRQERRELGAAPDRKTQPRAQRAGGHGGATPVGVSRRDRPLDRTRRSQGTHRSNRDAPACRVPRWPGQMNAKRSCPVPARYNPPVEWSRRIDRHGVGRVERPLIRKVRLAMPRRISSPSDRRADVMRSPCRYVPFLLPRSSSVASPFDTTMRA